MTIKTITFQQTFPTGPYMNQRLGVEIELEPEDYQHGEVKAVHDTFQFAKATVENAFKAMNPEVSLAATDFNTGEQNALSAVSRAPKPVINLEAERVAIQIENATDLSDLHALWDKAMEHQLNDEYQKRLKELS
jgi:hypothetical protein